MEYPPDDAMRALDALCHAEEVEFADGGEVMIRLIGGAWFDAVPLTIEAQEELERRGLVALVGVDEIEVTEAGLYYARRWRERGAARRTRA